MGRLRDWALTRFGDIKIFRHPFFLVYDPGGYQVKGRDLQALLRIVRPGDVLVRAFNDYLDGKFIPGHFSHVGLYLGETTPEDLRDVPEDQGKRFVVGKQVVIHSVAEGVGMEDLLDFGRCDRLAVLRFPATLRPTRGGVDTEPPDFTADERALRRRLVAEGVTFEEAWPIVRREALKQLGRGYDFDFDFTDVRRLSCTEFVYRATIALGPFLGVAPRLHRILFLSGKGIAPDAWVESPLDLEWVSATTPRDWILELRKPRQLD